ncbi:MAG: hypothetical protein FDZ70_07680, partial [Actinobacteria bacterium]
MRRRRFQRTVPRGGTMRRVTVLAVLCLAIAAATTALPATASAALPSVPSSKFTVAQGCGCHAALVEQWSKSMHSKALSDPLYQAKLAEANRATDGALGKFCEDCHGPISGMAGMNGKGAKPRDAVANEAVTCDFCHQVTGVTQPLANNSWTLTADGTKRAQLKDAKSPVHQTAYSAHHEKADFCGVCHNVNHPGNGLPLEATYTEWKNSPYAKEGITCQDCHMTPGPGVTKPNPGRAAPMAPEREHIYQMTFVGANAGLGDKATAEETLKAAAKVELDTAKIVEPGAKGKVAVKVTNVGAGHYLPTGLTEVRECWLQVTVADASGKALVSERRDFHTVLKDAKGNAPVELWEATGVKEDTRIAPKASKDFDFAFDMPAAGPVTVSAAMYYRSAPEELAEKAGVDIPTTEMAKVEQAVYATEAEAAKVESGGEVDEAAKTKDTTAIGIV